ncbi:MAG: alpha-glucosidase/alpha-galactosidase [Thermoplasmata archaeon]
MKHNKIAIIGAGSAIWSSNFVNDLCLTPDLSGSLVTFMDIDDGRLDFVTRFAKRFSSERKFDVSFAKTTNRRDALKDANLVVNMAMAGGHHYYEQMRLISEKFGYYRGINSVEWNMVSDYHTIWGYRQFKLAMEIAEDAENLCPDAWFIQLSNPVFELTTLLARETRLKVIGLCHGHLEAKHLVNAIGFDEREMEIESIGLNHTIWMTKFSREGKDEYPALREWVDSKYDAFLKDWQAMAKSNPFLSQMSPAMVDMYNNFSLVPIGDTVRSGTWKYHRDLRTKKRWYGSMGGFDSRKGWNYYLRMEREIVEGIKRAVSDSKTPVSSSFPHEISGEPVVPIIDTLLNDKKMLHQVNVANEGAIDGVPGSVATEFPAVVDGKGVHRPSGKRLPSRITNFSIKPRIMRMEWAIEAFLEGGAQTLESWLMSDPRTRNDKQVHDVVNALLSIPENHEMAKHFR